MVRAMANERFKFAIGRLDRVAARIERILAESSRVTGGQPTTDPGFAERHEQLRQQVRSAIGRIDTLIDSAVQ